MPAFSALLAPKSIAVVGASEDTSKTGGRALNYLEHFGYPGEIFAINPNRRTIQGHRTYASASDLPIAADLAIIAVPGEGAVESVAVCAKRGIGAAIVTSSGFAELGEEGRALEREMLTIARAKKMRIVGPNSQGIANFSNGTVASFSSLFLTYPPVDGPVAIISQSGSMSVVPYCQLRERGLGVRYCIATGNEADLSVGDFAELVLSDPDIGLILLYAESIADPQALIRATEIARAQGVPIVAIKAGRSPSGRSAALSHTGALANEDRVVSAFFERRGIYRADDCDELVRSSTLYLKRWRAPGRRLIILTDSGASAVMMADKAEQLGFTIGELPPDTQQRLASILPTYAAIRNPIDMTSVLRAEPQLFGLVLEALRQADDYDLLVVAFPASGVGYDVAGLARMAAEFSATGVKPLAIAVPQSSIAEPFRRAGLATFQSETEALLALSQLATHDQLWHRTQAPALPVEFSSLPAGNDRLVAEHDALNFFRSCGLPVAPFEVCQTLADTLRAFRRLGPRVVMKGLASGVAHKAVLGLVSLGIGDEAALETQFTRLSERHKTLDLPLEGIMVATEFRFIAEIAVGAKVDAVFGPVVMVGRGGQGVESGNEVKVLMAPVSPAEVLNALESLPSDIRLGDSKASITKASQSLAVLVSRVSSLIVDHQHDIASFDLNPVAIYDGEPVILDALIERVSR